MDKKIESGYLDYIVKNKFDQQNIDWTFITEESKNEIEGWGPKIKEFLANNKDFDNYTKEQRDQLFNDVIEMHESFKKAVKNTKCQLSLHGRELKFIKDTLEDTIEYDAGTVFYGIHLKGTWLNELKYNLNEVNNTLIGLTDTVILYDQLSTIKVKGLKEKALIFAKVLRLLAECSKIYQHYDQESERLFKLIRDWNLGLTNEDKAALAAAILNANGPVTEPTVEAQS